MRFLIVVWTLSELHDDNEDFVRMKVEDATVSGSLREPFVGNNGAPNEVKNGFEAKIEPVETQIALALFR
jgi:hypothetical protein